MKTYLLPFVIVLLFAIISAFNPAQNNQTNQETEFDKVITTDIDNFWEAYELIRNSNNRKEQLAILQKEFIEKGSPGLEMIMDARRYQAEEYVDAINNYPKFWESVKDNMYQSKTYGAEIGEGINKLRKLYPDLKPAKIYFTVGVFRTGGTIKDGNVLIGAETAMANKKAITDEFPDNRQFNNLRNYWKKQQLDDIVLTNVHEYIHTQQSSIQNSNLLFKCVNEGVAEFVSCLAMETNSTAPAIAYGFENNEKIRPVFEKEMFQKETGYWLWSSQENEFGVRDLGYYIGYAIAQQYYDAANDKKAAIKTMIDLDYSNTKQVEQYIDQSNYFKEPIAALKKKLAKAYLGDLIGQSIEEDGIKEAQLKYQQLIQNPSDKIINNENELNNLGYTYLAQEKIDEAIEIFKWNVNTYPESWNVYDSLGEAYLVKGDTTNSAIYYKKSLEINPDNQYGQAALKKMGITWKTQ